MKLIVTTDNSGTIEWSLPEELIKLFPNFPADGQQMVQQKMIDFLSGYVAVLRVTSAHYLRTGDPGGMTRLGETLMAFMDKEKMGNLKF